MLPTDYALCDKIRGFKGDDKIVCYVIAIPLSCIIFKYDTFLPYTL